MAEAQDNAPMETASGTKYFLKEVIPRGLKVLGMPGEGSVLPDEFSDNEEESADMSSLGRYVGSGVNLGVTSFGALVRMKVKHGTHAGDIPVNDKLGQDAKIMITDAKGRSDESRLRINPFWLYCIPGQLSLVKEYLNKSAMADVKHDIRTQDQAEMAALRIPTAPKILSDATFEDKRLLMKDDFLHELNLSRNRLPNYHTVFAFEKFVWDDELIDMLQGFQEKHPHDILPMGVIQVGLLNYWLKQRGWLDERTALLGATSLSEYLVYFVVCLARAVTMGTVFIGGPFEFNLRAWIVDRRGLDCEIHDDSIDATRCFEIIDRHLPKVVGKLITSDLEGAQQPRIDPDCDIFKKLLHVQGITTARDEAIRDTVQLIGNMRQHGAGRLLDLKAKRHFILMPMSMREPWDTSPIEVFEDGAPDTKTIKRIEKAHQARIYKFPDEDDEPYETSRKRTRAMIREHEDRLPHRKRQRMAQQVPGWDELSDQVKTVVKLSRMENTSPDDLTEAANFLRRVEGFEHGYRAGRRPEP